MSWLQSASRALRWFSTPSARSVACSNGARIPWTFRELSVVADPVDSGVSASRPSQVRSWPKDKEGFPIRTASAKKLGISTSPHKLNLVARLVRGLSVAEAERQLSVMLKKHRHEVLATIRAAVTNARSFGLSEERLIVSKAYVNKGQYLRRLRPWHGKGRYGVEHKKYAHLCIEVQELTDELWEAKVLPQYIHMRFKPEKRPERSFPENLVKPWLVKSQLDLSLAETLKRKDCLQQKLPSRDKSDDPAWQPDPSLL